ncbi:MAG: flagellar export chaperone FliS [Gallionellales bacterium GWA2_59_43]|nr:MAG: flagellar export chaperone FliS [Gallionellales bacterium GWA2_59_43]
MNASLAIKAYTNVGVESNVIAADPHKLISMLYQGALLAIANAKNAIQRKDIPAKCAAISKALLIIDEGLNASLDKKVGGELAGNLSSLYNYMCSRLAQANIKNDVGALDEVSTLLADLKGAWDSIRPTTASSNAVTAPMSVTTPPSRPAAPSKLQMAYGRA